MTERIIIEVDDTALDEALAKLQQAVALSQTALGTPNIQQGSRNLMGEWRQLEKSWSLWLTESEQGGFSAKDLPTINRELRIILGQIPGMREAMRLYFNLKRVARGLEVGEVTMVLSLLATAVVLLQRIQAMQSNIERREREQERRIRQARGFTHEQYLGEMARWEEYTRGMPP